MSCNLFSIISWFMLSNALLIFSDTTAVNLFLSMLLRMASVVRTRINEVSVKWSFLFPLCVVDNLLFDSRQGTSRLRATLSHIFDRMGMGEMSLILFGSSWSPSWHHDIDRTTSATCEHSTVMNWIDWPSLGVSLEQKLALRGRNYIY